MKKLFLFISLILCSLSYAQVPDWVVNTVRPVNTSVVAPGGQIFVAGNFTGTVDFDPRDEGTRNLSAHPSIKSSFISKFNAAGEFLWAKSIGNDVRITIIHVMTIHQNKLYVLGTFRGDLDLNLDGGQHIVSSEGNSLFLAVYGLDGTFIQGGTIDGEVRSPDISSHNLSYQWTADNVDLHINENNNTILISGNFTEETDFDMTSDEYIVTPVGSVDMFLANYSLDGDLIWVNTWGKEFDALSANAVKTDTDGNIYLAGYFSGQGINFDVNNGGTHILSSGYYSNSGGVNYDRPSTFIAKYDSNMNFIFAKRHHISGNRDHFLEMRLANDKIFLSARSAYYSLWTTFGAAHIIALDQNGDFSWGHIGQSSSVDAIITDIELDANDGVLFGGGNGEHNGFIFGKLDQQGSIEYQHNTEVYPNATAPFEMGGDQAGSFTSIMIHEFKTYLMGRMLHPSSTIDFDMSDSGEFWVGEEYGFGNFLVKYSETPLSSSDDLEIHDRFTIYPNPADSELKIQSTQRTSENKFTVYNILGKQLLSIKIDDLRDRFTLPVEHLESGVYLLQIENNLGISTQKFMKR